MGLFRINMYHGTDQSVVEPIINEGFQCKKSNVHWLGHGIYFFADRSLAEWWTTNPTNKHGMPVKHPAIIKCTLEADEKRVLNLCALSDYCKYVDIYNSFFRQWAYQSKDEAQVDFMQLRCAFFNYLSTLYALDVIVAPFILPDQPYMPRYNNSMYANNMHIMYEEIQIRVSETAQSVIKDKDAYILLGGGNDED